MSIGEYEIKDFIEEWVMDRDDIEKTACIAFDNLILNYDSVKEDIFRIWTLESNHDYEEGSLIDGSSSLEELISDFVKNQVLEGSHEYGYSTCFISLITELIDEGYNNHRCSYILGEMLSMFQTEIEDSKEFLTYEFCDESYLVDYLTNIIENNTLNFKEVTRGYSEMVDSNVEKLAKMVDKAITEVEHEPCERCQRLSIKSCRCGR